MKTVCFLLALVALVAAHDKMNNPAGRAGVEVSTTNACDAPYDPDAATIEQQAGENFVVGWDGNHNPPYALYYAPSDQSDDVNAYTKIADVTDAVRTTEIMFPDDIDGKYTLRWTWTSYVSCADYEVTPSEKAIAEQKAKEEAEAEANAKGKGVSGGAIAGILIGVAVVGGAGAFFAYTRAQEGATAAYSTPSSTGFSPQSYAPSSTGYSPNPSTGPSSFRPAPAAPTSYAPQSYNQGPPSYAPSSTAPSSYAPSSYGAPASTYGPPSTGHTSWNRSPAL